ncbi:phage portal protein [Glaciihabitans sp. INWT7]|uniref:hypothetical protein n=1 Tax=Glaciihabitans sp. INWT7 TaxID=2596912 RepID=UPI001623BD86|nr:hypothetical protein [Glaciihabitans sp. INWT7]QNE47408.1 phage portal protein [Glaciihabitans sp. INWT7]
MNNTKTAARWATGVAVSAGLALALGTGGLAATAATTPTPVSTSSASCSFGEHLVSAWRAVPSELRTDLKAARALKPGADRRDALKKIEANAIDGGYGAGVEVRAEWRKDHRGDKLRPLPESLKADLKTLHATPKAAQGAEAQKIADTAVAGGYGATIESFAKAVQSSPAWKDCTPSAS